MEVQAAASARSSGTIATPSIAAATAGSAGATKIIIAAITAAAVATTASVGVTTVQRTRSSGETLCPKY
jgi:hypothetical protein